MQNGIRGLKPESIWRHFADICSIPHPSRKEQMLAEHIEKFAANLGLDVKRDEPGNLIIKKPATPGYENRRTIVLQAHIDMVPQKNSGTNHDFEKDPIQPTVNDGWVVAKGTTLGADNGIGVAAALAVLESKELVHGPVEVLLTVDEETGMTGAFGLKPGLLSADFLFNLDNEEEGEMCVGCAGGVDTNAYFKVEQEPVGGDLTALGINVSGLKGGHSGCDIHIGRANALKLMGRVLSNIKQRLPLKLAKIEGGSLRNAIPREAGALIFCDKKHEAELTNLVQQLANDIRLEFGDVETDLVVGVSKVSAPAFALKQEMADRLIESICACPNGVIRMHTQLAGTVESSTNLGVIVQDNDTISIRTLQRSSVETAKFDVANMVASAFRLAGARVEHVGAYPGWKPNLTSEALKLLQRSYFELHGKESKLMVTHGGLECGLIGAVYPKMEMVSFGPTIRFPHSPDEKVEIASVGKFWDLLVHALAAVPKK